MAMRGIRGATTVAMDSKENVLMATRELLNSILDANPDLKPGDIASAFFTVTEDILSVYPALAARQLGWDQVPLMCAREISVTGGLPLCIRVLILWNTIKVQPEIKHIYLREAIELRPDLYQGHKEQPV